MSQEQSGQLSRAEHAFLGRKTQGLDLQLWGIYTTLRDTYGERSRDAVTVTQIRNMLLSLRLQLVERCMNEYGEHDQTTLAYHQRPETEGPDDRPPGALHPENADAGADGWQG